MKIDKDKLEKYSSAYSDDSFIKKITSFSKNLGVQGVFLAFVIWYFLRSDTTGTSEKVKFVVSKFAIIGIPALGYFISPIDLIPDIIPFVGLTDDIIVLLFAVQAMLGNDILENNYTIDIITKSKEATLKMFPGKETEIDKIIRKKFPFYYEQI